MGREGEKKGEGKCFEETTERTGWVKSRERKSGCLNGSITATVCFGRDVGRAEDVGQEIEAGGYAENSVRVRYGRVPASRWHGLGTQNGT